MGDKPTVAIRANSSEQKENWKEAVKESEEYSSLSHLIRKSVERELAGAYDSGGTTTTQHTDERIGELLTAVEGIEGRLGEVESTVDRATDAMHAGGTSVSEDVTTAVYESLPEGPSNARSTHWIAEEAGRDDTTVRVALEQLERTTGVVNKVEMKDIVEGEDGQIIAGEEHEDPHWFKRV